MTAVGLHADHRQSQTLSPRLQRAVRLLQMSSLDFAAQLRDMLGRNPFLETDEIGGDDELPSELPLAPLEDTPALTDSMNDATAPEGVDGLVSTAGPESDSEMNDRDLWQADAGAGTRRADDSEITAMDLTAVDTPLNTHLHRQLAVMPLTPRDRALAGLVVESLDDDGYLRTSLEDLAEVAGLDPAASPAELQIALRHVQALEPAGVGARDVAECLRLQLPAVECPQQRDLARRIIDGHLKLLAARDISGLARHLGETPARVEQACDRIRRLDPRPGWRIGSSRIAYVVPDVIVKKVQGRWVVQLNAAVVPRLRLNQVYAELFQRHRSPANAEMAGHLQEARWALRNVEQRFSTILSVAEAVVRRQRHFLEYGPMAMRPLCLREIADEVGIHESTVSRVTNNKYMATPIGVFELKYFFSRAMVGTNGAACSGTAIRGLIKDIIATERPEAPLSDAEITRQLALQGLVVARRTVTKYRQMLKIDAVDRRRRLVQEH